MPEIFQNWQAVVSVELPLSALFLQNLISGQQRQNFAALQRKWWRHEKRRYFWCGRDTVGLHEYLGRCRRTLSQKSRGRAWKKIWGNTLSLTIEEAATSGNREHIETAFQRLGIGGYFQKIFTSSEVGVGKSNPLIYQEAAKFLGNRTRRNLCLWGCALCHWDSRKGRISYRRYLWSI